MTNNKTLIEHGWARPDFDILKKAEWEFTEKVDGEQVRIFFDEATGDCDYFGKADLSILRPVIVKALDRIITPDVRRKLAPYGNCTLFAEGFGGNVQKAGPLYGPDTEIVLFDVWLDYEQRYMNRVELERLRMQLNIPAVPHIGYGTLYEMVERVRDGFKSNWGDFTAEGIVARPAVELTGPNGRVITKLKRRDFEK